jgi:hypothetical protein
MLASSMMFSDGVISGFFHSISGYQLTRSVAINLKRIDLTISGMRYNAILRDSGPNPACKIVHVICRVSLVSNLGHDLRSRIEISSKHHVGWDKELIDRPVPRDQLKLLTERKHLRIITWAEC